MYHRRLVVALAAGTAVVGTMIPVMSSASAHKPSVLGCAADNTPPTTVLDDAGTDTTVSTTTTIGEVDEAPATSVAEDADVTPSSEPAPPSTESVASDVPDESVPALSADVDASAAASPSGVRSTRSPAADPIKHKYEITVKITTVKGRTKIDKWEFTPHGNPCRVTGVEWSIGLGGNPARTLSTTRW